MLCHLCRVAKGRLAREQLVKDDAKGPPVDGETMRLFLAPSDLRCKILRRAACGDALHDAVLVDVCCEPKVNKANVPKSADHDIIRFEIAVRDAGIVEAAQRKRHFRDIKFDRLLREPAPSSFILLKSSPPTPYSSTK